MTEQSKSKKVETKQPEDKAKSGVETYEVMEGRKLVTDHGSFIAGQKVKLSIELGEKLKAKKVVR